MFTIKKRIKITPFRLGLLLTILIALLASLPLFKSGYFTMHDDVQVMRLYQMERCFQDGQIPCRWVPDMGGNYGHPLYNYHPVFAYYLGTFFRIFGFSFIAISKLLFLLTFLLPAVFIYLLVNAFLGVPAALAAAAFFTFAPYHSLDVYVRGAMTESWGIVFFPAIFLSLYRLSQKPKKPLYFILSTLSLTGLFLAHNIMTLLFTPIALVWGLYWFISNGNLKHLLRLIATFALSFGLSAFFLLPAFFERPLVKIDTLTTDYYNFRHHFASLRQLFLDRSWGYGPSRPGPEDQLSFQLGWPHWWLSVAGLCASLILFIKKRSSALTRLAIFASLLYMASVFMTHAKSVYLWELVPLLSFVQFPWRFLGIAMFAGALLFALLFALIPSRLRWPISLLLSAVIVALNFSYFTPEKHFPNMTDQLKLSGEEYRIQSLATILDYIPTQVKEHPNTLAPALPWVVEGEADISQFRKRSNFWRFTVNNSSNQPAVVRVPVFDFPHWIVLLDQQPIEFHSNNPGGVIEFTIPPGQYTAVGRFTNTPLRSAANLITLSSFAILLIFTIHTAKKHENKK